MTTTMPDLMPSGGQPPITLQDMLDREKLITVDGAREVLGRTEPLAYRSFETGPAVRFRVGDSWDPESFSVLHGTADLPVHLSISQFAGSGESAEYQLSKDAVLEAAKLIPGMSQAYVANAPSFLIEDTLNHWYRGGGLDKSLQLMTVGDRGSAIVRESLVPFSNLSLLDRALAAVEDRHPGAEVYVDATKIAHSLRQTYLQLVIPDLARLMDNTGEPDDRWWGGVQFANSQAGETQTGVDGFMFRMRCTNGMIERSGTASSWSRRGQGGNSASDAYEWAQIAVDEVLGGLEESFNKVQALTEHVIEGQVNASIADVFEAHRIPARARERIMESLVESDQLNMYALTNAVTQAANTADSAREQQQLMRAGGEVVEHGERCSAANPCHRLVMSS